MKTTITSSKETKGRLLKLDIADKGKTFDMLVNELISYSERNEKEHKKYLEEKAMWDRLLVWTKKEEFKR